MLVEHSLTLPQGDEWEYEVGWAGERVLANKDGSSVCLTSVLRQKDVTNRFPVVAAVIAKLPPASLVLDGVICAIEPWQFDAFDKAGILSSSPLVPRLHLIAMDLLWVDGTDLRQIALVDRKQRLRELVKNTAVLMPGAPAVGADEIFAQAKRVGAEAVIAKRRGSRYRPFGRAGDWVRVAVEATAFARPARAGNDSPLGVGSTNALGFGQMA